MESLAREHRARPIFRHRVVLHTAVELWLFPDRKKDRRPAAIGSTEAPSCSRHRGET